jgi:hypothetical protein
MTVTCIINQFDCKDGTKGPPCCIVSGKLKLAKALINKALEDVIEPIKVRTKDENFAVENIYICVIKCKQVQQKDKNINDSYKLLNGKCPDSNQRRTNSIKRAPNDKITKILG